jgi:hypothetical protein
VYECCKNSFEGGGLVLEKGPSLKGKCINKRRCCGFEGYSVNRQAHQQKANGLTSLEAH